MVQAALRGKLKIFFGAFPGAGKTNAMLGAAHRMRDAGRDVVAAVVDTHESADRVLLEGLERLAPSPDTPEGELDLDGAIKRKPHVLLLDDLAHSNPPGARHPKRWNDVDEILANGIDVFTTMSVQHVESLNDVVGEITGIREAETVPDTFFDTADETVMVDMSADELLLRLRAGMVHVGDAEKGVEGTYFSKGSLLALREIALRRTADVVEDELQKYRVDKAIEAVWKTQGRVLCCIGPDRGAEHVVRSAARMARRLSAPWTAAYVETPDLQRLPEEERARILGVVRLAEDLGADSAILTGNDICQAIVDYTREQNIGMVVVGRGRPRRVAFSRSMSDQIASAAESLDVIEIGRGGSSAGVAVQAQVQREREADGSRAGEKRVRYVWTALGCAAATALLGAMHARLDLATIAMTYMLTVVLLAVKWGRGPAVVGSALNVVAFDFFFVPPRFSLMVSEPAHLLTFTVMFIAGALIGELAGRLRFQARVASHREKRARTLYEFARDLARLRNSMQVIETTEEFMSRHFRAKVALLVPDATGMLISPTARGMTNPFDSTAAQWAFDQAQQAGAGTDTLAANEYLFLPLRSPTRVRGVLAVRPERTRELFIPEQRHQFEIFAALVATALERVYYVDVARDAMLMAGLHSGEVRLERERRSLSDLVDAAIRALGPATAKHEVSVDLPRDLPHVSVDPALIQRVLTSVIGNAVRHTPVGTSVKITARADGRRAEVSVEDNGPGLPKGREEEIFDAFARGEASNQRRGAGLGLAISRVIIEAHGGTIRSEPRGKGARLVFTLPFG